MPKNHQHSMFVASFQMGLAAGMLMGVTLLIMPAHADTLLAVVSAVSQIL